MNLITIRKELGDIFSLNELAKLTNKSKKYLSVYIHKNIKKGYLYEIRNGWYSFERVDDKFLISRTFENSYISLQSAIEFYGFSTQRYVKLHLMSLSSKEEKNIGDFVVEFIKTKKQRFFGFKKETYKKNEILLADYEKLLLDCLNNQDKISVEETISFLDKIDIDLERLKTYVKIIDSKALNKRLGYILEKKGIDMELEINAKYELFDLNGSKEGKKNKKWKLIIREGLNL